MFYQTPQMPSWGYSPRYSYQRSSGFSPWSYGFFEPQMETCPCYHCSRSYGYPVNYYTEGEPHVYPRERRSAASSRRGRDTRFKSRRNAAEPPSSQKSSASAKQSTEENKEDTRTKVDLRSQTFTEEKLSPTDNENEKQTSSAMTDDTSSSDDSSCSQSPTTDSTDDVQTKLLAISSISNDVNEILNRYESSSKDDQEKELRYCEEMLTRCLLKLDDIATNNNQEIRSKRKQLAVYINETLSKLDTSEEEIDNADADLDTSEEEIDNADADLDETSTDGSELTANDDSKFASTQEAGDVSSDPVDDNGVEVSND